MLLGDDFYIKSDKPDLDGGQPGVRFTVVASGLGSSLGSTLR